MVTLLLPGITPGGGEGGRGGPDMGSRASLVVGRAAAVTEYTDRVAAAP